MNIEENLRRSGDQVHATALDQMHRSCGKKGKDAGLKSK